MGHAFMLAPMAELSHRALRELIQGFSEEQNKNADIVYFTEMISAAGLLSGGPFEKWYLDNEPCPAQLVYQLVSSDPDQLVKAAVLLDRQECLGIDINMGCSAPAITRTGAGVRWMEDTEKAARLVERLRRLTKKQLSVKIRLGPKVSGRENEEWGTEALLRFCLALEEAGLDLIILHPRQAAEKFKRRARWEYVETLRRELKIPVAGNGDIAGAEELAKKAADGPVMAGRLLVREPWAFAEAYIKKNISPIILEETGLRFLELLTRYQPPEFHLSRARRFFRYFCDNITWAEYLRNKINREESLAGIGKLWQDYFRHAALLTKETVLTKVDGR